MVQLSLEMLNMKILKTNINKYSDLTRLNYKNKNNINMIEKLFDQKNRGRIIVFTYEIYHYQSLHLIYLSAILKAVGFEVYIAHCFDITNACEIKIIKLVAIKFVLIV